MEYIVIIGLVLFFIGICVRAVTDNTPELNIFERFIIVCMFVILPVGLAFMFMVGLTEFAKFASTGMFDYTGEYLVIHGAIHKHIAKVASSLDSLFFFGMGSTGMVLLISNAFTNLLIIIMGIGIGNKINRISKNNDNKELNKDKM